MGRSTKKTTGDGGSAKVTIFDVAHRAGVSIKTVSRVVNKEPNVSEKTREKVDAAIAALDYRPNAAARGLSSSRSFIVGLIYENPDEFSYMKDVLNGALLACESAGYTLILRPVAIRSNPNLASQVKQFVDEAGIGGVVLPAPVGDLDEVLNVLRNSNVPFATITLMNSQADAISVQCDDEHATASLTQYLIDNGHRRIGFIKGHPAHAATSRRLAGYKSALKRHKITYARHLVRQGYFDFKSGRSATAKLLDADEPPSAIIASNDDMAAGAIFEARERGLDIPKQLAVVGFDDTHVASHVWPQLTTARQPIEEMARVATHLLIQKLSGREAISPEDLFTCELIIRESA